MTRRKQRGGSRLAGIGKFGLPMLIHALGGLNSSFQQRGGVFRGKNRQRGRKNKRKQKGGFGGILPIILGGNKSLGKQLFG